MTKFRHCKPLSRMKDVELPWRFLECLRNHFVYSVNPEFSEHQLLLFPFYIHNRNGWYDIILLYVRQSEMK